MWVPGELGLDVLEKDPSDNRFLECAFEGEADYLVTGDQDLLNVGQFQKITILTPREFLRVLREQKKG
jgi:predicted nucleic acid-binding protein